MYKKVVNTRLRRAVARGDIGELPCGVCGEEEVQGHHDDYDKWDEVVWLCTKHHGLRHREINAEMRANGHIHPNTVYF